MEPQVRNLLTTVAVLLWARTLDTSQRTLLAARAAYAAYAVLALVLNLVVWHRVRTLRDRRVIAVPKKPTVENQRPSPDEVESTTVMQYDLGLLGQARSQLLMQTGMLVFMHWKTGSITPLVLQSVMGVVRLFDDSMVKIHVLGEPAEGALERPFKSGPNPLEQLLKRLKDNTQQAQGQVGQANEADAPDASGSGDGSEPTQGALKTTGSGAAASTQSRVQQESTATAATASSTAASAASDGLVDVSDSSSDEDAVVDNTDDAAPDSDTDEDGGGGAVNGKIAASSATLSAKVDASDAPTLKRRIGKAVGTGAPPAQ